ncbi:MAG: preprotein translocase subunit SecG [Bryobacteraceae bacterium]
MLFLLLKFIHVLVCLFLIVVVLLQSGKAADLAGAFGGMGSQTAFGPRGSATLLSKATTVSAIVFMITSLSLSILETRLDRSGGSKGSVLEKQSQQPKPATGTSTTTLPPQPGQPAQPATKQPSVTLTDEQTGATRTMPIEIPKPGETKQQPAQKAPEKK